VNWQEVEVRTWLVTEYFQQHSELPHLTLHLQPVAHPIPVQKRLEDGSPASPNKN
jgi:hypothetical protein